MHSDLRDSPLLVWVAGVTKSRLAGPAFAGNDSHGETGSTITGASTRPSVLLSLGLVNLGTGTAWASVQHWAHMEAKQIFVELPLGSQN